MLKNRRPVILLLAIIAVLNVAGMFLALRTYPCFTVSRAGLLGENGENLKDFRLNEDGSLISVSDDPWIYYVFGEPVNIRFLSVETSQVTGTETKAQFYLMPSARYRSMDLEKGRLSAGFGLAQGSLGVGAIRLDMATEPGASFQIGQAVINDRLAVILDFQRFFAAALGIILLALAEILGWRRLLYDAERHGGSQGEKRAVGGLALRKVPTVVCAALQAVLKLALVWILRKPLIDNDGVSHQHLLCWMLLLGLEILCISALHLGAGKQKRNIWCSFAMTVPFALVWFSAAELLNLETFDFQTPSYLGLNLFLCALVPMVFLAIFRNGALGFSAAALIFMALSVGNHYYGMLRNNPLEYFDIANAGTAVHVVSNYKFVVDAETWAALLAAMIIVLVMFSSFGIHGFGWKLPSVAGGLAAAGVLTGLFILNIPVFGNFSNLQIITKEKGYLLSFTSFIKMGRIESPEGYSFRSANEILAEAGSETPAEEESEAPAEAGAEASGEKQNLPNIIVIMDETLADLPAIYGFDTTEDTLPNLHSMTENTVHGQVLTSVYGGGTANTEYEFLTGNSLYFFPPGSSPYVQYTGRTQQSLAWKLKNMGYSVASYHPYLAISYRRSAVYPLLGLEPFYSEEDELPHREYLRSYLSDRADFKNVIHLYEQKEPGQPFFMFNVTMQNHGGYSTEEPAVEVTVRPVDEELNTPSMLEYLSLIHETDAAFKELVDYFSGVEEDTIILIFGDHQPSMDGAVTEFMDRKAAERSREEAAEAAAQTAEEAAEEVTEAAAQTAEEATEEAGQGTDSQLRYYATFAIWANYDIEEKTGVITSPNFLRTMLLSYAGVEKNAYESFLERLSQEYPAMNAFGYLDSQEGWKERQDETVGMMEQYEYLIYNNVFDKKNMEAGYYE